MDEKGAREERQVLEAISYEEKRRYFRIDDHIMLKYRVIPSNEVQAVSDRLRAPLPNAFSLSSDFAELKQESALLQRSVENSSPAVAQYISMLDKKLDMIAKVLLVQNMGADEHLWRKVNLGAGGMAFDSHVEIPVSSVLEVKMGLLPSHAGLITIGKVIRCQKRREGSGYNVAICFLHVRDSDRELLVQHVLWRQAQMLRESRQADLKN
ncbi:MAG: PilZ domain-containing protein [Gammaproteobacteria bacterium]|nr:MAG: PilZ domain-containing protein [Gammaproteobacteria bacterium]